MTDWKPFVRARLAERADDDAVEELAQHVADVYREALAAGASDAQAHARAAAELDDAEALERALRLRTLRRPAPAPPPASSRPRLFADFAQDVRYAARLLVGQRAFAFVAIVTIALGIGVNTTIFSIVNAVLLRPLPYPDADRIVVAGTRGDAGKAHTVGYTTVHDWRAQATSFDHITAIRSWYPTLVDPSDPERLQGLRVSWDFFRMLGVRPALGRDFRADEDRPGDASRVVLISDGLWRRRFGGDPAIVGRSIALNDVRYTVVGVLAPEFEPIISAHFYQPAEVWAPLAYEPSLPYACRSCQHLRALARVKPGTSVERARAELDGIHERLRAAYPDEYDKLPITLVPLSDELSRGVARALYVLAGAVAFVLLIACANVANLLLARSASRQRELAVRAAIGAARGRLMRQLVAESLLLAVCGGALGLALTVLGAPALTDLAPASVPRLDQVGIDGSVLAFTAIVTLVTGLLFGLIPAIRLSMLDVQSTLRTEGRGAVRGSTQLTQRALVVADVALALVLLTGAGLMLRTVDRLVRVNPGFDAENVLALTASLTGNAYDTDAKVQNAIARILERLRSLPGVQAAAAASQIPFGGNFDRYGFHIQGEIRSPADSPSVERYSVTPDYFRAMRIPLRRGRFFTSQEYSDGSPVLVIGETTARRLFAGRDSLGQHVRVGDHTRGPWRTIIGVVGDVRHQDVSVEPAMQMYLPQGQPYTDSFPVIVVRSAIDPASLAIAARREILAAAPGVPIYDVATMESLLVKSMGQQRFMTVLLMTFAGLALLMVAIGVYGVIAFSVAQRTQELGVRLALGAARGDILRLVLGMGARLVAAGVAIGLIGAALTTRYLGTLLFGVDPIDPPTFVAVVGGLSLVALAAHLVPLRRALGVDPLVALRQQ